MMGDREDPQQGRARLGGILLGLVLAAFLVVVNGLAAFNLVPSSYQQFTWTAYAAVLYPNGASCETSDQCHSNFCVSMVCCNSICDVPGQTCATGTCVTPAPAPAVSNRTLVLIVALLLAIGFFALAPLRSGKRR